jgi:hypothetical protein
MKKLFFSLLIVLFCTSFVYSETLSWDVVSDTEDYTIAGYVVYFWDSEAPDIQYSYVTNDPIVVNIENTLNLIPGTTYQFIVTPYTTFNELGEESPPVEFVCGERPALENNLPTHIYIPGPVNITIEAAQ